MILEYRLRTDAQVEHLLPSERSQNLRPKLESPVVQKGEIIASTKSSSL
jgi:hypothetical protein